MIRIGPAGWSYKDWEGIVYPTNVRRFDPLSYLAHYFDTIEINSSFYRVPPESHALSWARRVAENDDFRFTIKLFRDFTHTNEPPRGEDVDAFRKFLDRLDDKKRLGALLIQFPWSFKASEESLERLERLLKEFEAYPKAVEVRHGSFATDRFVRFLDEHDTAFVNIDQPIFGDSIEPSSHVIGPVGYVRLHGRNYEKWFAHEESWERYDYLYTRDQLSPWVERVRTMAAEKDVYAVTNNHFRGQAIVNALDMRSALGMKVEVPPTLADAYGERARFPTEFRNGA
ncbi:MAG TPA: DUF72 domain-containing protein [Thermoanaerobaculia bacterium]